jgi:hypothetical protein
LRCRRAVAIFALHPVFIAPVSFLTDYHGDRSDRRPPARVYARVDSIEPLGIEGTAVIDMSYPCSPESADAIVMLDSVDADWFDDTEAHLAETSDDADWNVSVVETSRAALEQLIPNRQQVAEGAWLELLLRDTDSAPPCSHYLNLYGPADRQAIVSARILPEIDGELTRRTNMDHLPDASEADLLSVLPAVVTECAAVYDVGQGNCNALLGDRNVPFLYYDFGGGVAGNRQSFPGALSSFCFTETPTIVLSHWDWDHWSSANRDANAYALPWIVPREPKALGPVHATFLGRLSQRATLLVWPSTLQRLICGDYELIKCTGPPHSRNDSGLALSVEHLDAAAWMLFPADAEYRYIPFFDHPLIGLVASHHGANTHGRGVPAPSGPDSVLVYSYGAGNGYPHPSDAGRAGHSAWQRVLETANRDSTGLGHVHLYWTEDARGADPACGGSSCDLTCHQR